MRAGLLATATASALALLLQSVPALADPGDPGDPNAGLPPYAQPAPGSADPNDGPPQGPGDPSGGPAQEQGDPNAGPPQGQGDPGVARISVAQGDISVKRADSGDTFAAALNAPVTAGDYITTGGDGRGEVEFDFGASLRLAPGTQLRFTDLQQDHHQLQLAQGTVELRLFRGLGSHPEVQTPAATIRPDENGSYRVTVTDDGNTEVTVRAGRADVETSAGTQSLEAGPTLLVTGTADNARVQTIDTVALDSFDAFNRQRDQYAERAHDWAYVDAGYVGADDLDQYGHWSDVPGYGEAWQPADVAPGWAPYNAGRWVWEPYYGWSWVDAAPWGYAPYHYGRWFYANSGWFWSPGITVAAGPVFYSAPVAFYPHPVFYRPALVAFFSFGAGGGYRGGVGFGGLSIGFGNVGWVPLAPYEPFHPWYGPGYGGNVYNRTVINNVTNNYYGNRYVTNNGSITNYRNINAPGGAVAVNNGNFASGNFAHLESVHASELTNASPIRGVVPVVPTAANLAYSGRALSPLHAAAPVTSRFANFASQPHAPAATFAQQQRAVQSAAVKTYPEHAVVFQHPDLQQKYDRPGLISNANAPAAFKPNATLNEAETGHPAAIAGPEKAAPGTTTERASGEPARTASPNGSGIGGSDETRTGNGSNASRPANPFDRFDRPATANESTSDTHANAKSGERTDATGGERTNAPGRERTNTPAGSASTQQRVDGSTTDKAPASTYHEPSDSVPTYPKPDYHEPSDSAPAYHQPSYHEPASDAPAYHAPSDHNTPYHTPSDHTAPYHAPAYHAPARQNGGHASSKHDAKPTANPKG
jgi:hypothetical protein